MKFNDRMNDLCYKPSLFGVTSSEDIYWYSVGYSFVERNYGKVNMETNHILSKFQNFILSKYNVSSFLNWGILIRGIAISDSKSIALFKELFNNVKIEETPFNNFCSYNKEQIERKITFKDLLQNIIAETNINNILQLQMFLLGFELAYIDFQIEDNEFNWFRKNKVHLNESILEELELPLYLNSELQLFARFYPTPLEAIDFFIKRALALYYVDNKGLH
ncbi:MAG: hypothetical protein A3F72_16620 [Bacteroidetes bacterium RIFCSPLOWO2_12_FULL_35_15]|nr:MAG: hypothetical protein A3F72_16620 [Bacteroidetes bacterium RIFCSPLOWO2_12_FULL_35_15]